MLCPPSIRQIKVSKAYIFWCHPTAENFQRFLQISNPSFKILQNNSSLRCHFLPSYHYVTPLFLQQFSQAVGSTPPWCLYHFLPHPHPCFQCLAKFCLSFQLSLQGYVNFLKPSLIPQMSNTLSQLFSVWDAIITKLYSLQDSNRAWVSHSDSHNADPHLPCFKVAIKKGGVGGMWKDRTFTWRGQRGGCLITVLSTSGSASSASRTRVFYHGAFTLPSIPSSSLSPFLCLSCLFFPFFWVSCNFL